MKSNFETVRAGLREIISSSTRHTALDALADIELNHDRRVTELLQANNKLVEENRQSSTPENPSEIKNKVIFMAAKEEDGTPTIILGIPKESWDYMKDGNTHTFDFITAGIPLKLVLFGAATQDDALNMIKDGAQAGGILVNEKMETDFSIKEKTKH